MIRVRFAPSPTGNLHLGTLRTALFTWLFAKHHNGQTILRIEDTDLERSNPKYEQSIFEGLNWLGLDFDESPLQEGSFGPYRQSERIAQGIYKTASDKLVTQKDAYPCFCSEEDLNKEREAAKASHQPYVYSKRCLSLSHDEIEQKKKDGVSYTIRFKMQDQKPFTFTDLIRGDITFDLALISDFVIIKSDGSPSYNFACAVDDGLMNVTHVIRGEDHISNTPRQLALYQALTQDPPQFGHLPMILGSDKSKLSKRHGATNVIEYREQGFLKEAMFNYMTLLGWTPPDEKEILSKQAIIDAFSLDRITKSGAVFDLKKLTWMNGQYIRKLDAEALKKAVLPYITPEDQDRLNKKYTEKEQQQLCFSVRDNLDQLSEINTYMAVYLESFDQYCQKVTADAFQESDHQVIQLFKEKLAKFTESPTETDLNNAFDTILEETGFGKGKVLRPIRIAVTGDRSGPNLGQVLEVLGRNEIQKRLNYLYEKGYLST